VTPAHCRPWLLRPQRPWRFDRAGGVCRVAAIPASRTRGGPAENLGIGRLIRSTKAVRSGGNDRPTPVRTTGAPSSRPLVNVRKQPISARTFRPTTRHQCVAYFCHRSGTAGVTCYASQTTGPCSPTATCGPEALSVGRRYRERRWPAPFRRYVLAPEAKGNAYVRTISNIATSDHRTRRMTCLPR
jgi:hypothetical protein